MLRIFEARRLCLRGVSKSWEEGDQENIRRDVCYEPGMLAHVHPEWRRRYLLLSVTSAASRPRLLLQAYSMRGVCHLRRFRCTPSSPFLREPENSTSTRFLEGNALQRCSIHFGISPTCASLGIKGAGDSRNSCWRLSPTGRFSPAALDGYMGD